MCETKVALNNLSKCSNFCLFWLNIKNEGARAQKSKLWLVD